jgi:hypothetical protein
LPTVVESLSGVDLKKVLEKLSSGKAEKKDWGIQRLSDDDCLTKIFITDKISKNWERKTENGEQNRRSEVFNPDPKPPIQFWVGNEKKENGGLKNPPYFLVN